MASTQVDARGQSANYHLIGKLQNEIVQEGREIFQEKHLMFFFLKKYYYMFLKFYMH